MEWRVRKGKLWRLVGVLGGGVNGGGWVVEEAFRLDFKR